MVEGLGSHPRIGIYIEDFNDNSDGEISSVRVLKLADASRLVTAGKRSP